MNCKIGDLAVIIRPVLARNLGALVEIVDVWPDEPRHWWVRSLSGPRPRACGDEKIEAIVIEEVNVD